MDVNKEKLINLDPKETLLTMFKLDPEQFRVKLYTGHDLDIRNEEDVKELASMINEGEVDFNMKGFLKSFNVSKKTLADL